MNENQQLIKYLYELEQKLKKVYSNFYKDVLTIKGVRDAIAKGNSNFTFDKNNSANRKLQILLQTRAGFINTLATTGISKAWKMAEKHVDTTVVNQLGKEANSIIQKTESAHRAGAMNAQTFSNQQRGGLNLSSRVWNLNANTIKEIEILLQNGIKEGKSSRKLSKDFKQFLNNPDEISKRVKNKETGEREVNKAYKDYHPGRGVYRSAYRNTMRLLRTEVNRAYRRATWERFQLNPLIVGIEILLSNNHTTLINGKPVPFVDICDELRGIYPKEFLWEGWHPQCRCNMLPVFASDKDEERYYDLLRENKENEFKAKDTIKDVPDNFKKWLIDNQKRIEAATEKKTLPYWMVDNTQYTTTFVSRKGETSNVEPYQRLHSTEQILARIQELENLLPKMENAMIRKIEMKKDMKGMGTTDASGSIYLRKDQYEAFNNAVDKLMRGKANEITAIEAQATLTYWHERTHNLSYKSLTLAKLNNKEENFMEVATEFVAQKTLPNFYKMFNAEMPSKINISSRYVTMVSNYQTAVDKLSKIGELKSNDVVDKLKNSIINNEWENQRQGLIDALYGAKINRKIIDKRTLGRIVDNTLDNQDFQFERKLDKILDDLINQAKVPPVSKNK